MTFYIASSLDNVEAVNALRDQLVALGHHQTYDWTLHGSVQGEGAARLAEVAAAEVAGVLLADFMVVLLPGMNGTHVELGIAMGVAILRGAVGQSALPTIYLLAEDMADADPLAPRDGRRTCAFYHHDSVVVVRSVESLLRLLWSADQWRRVT